MVRRLKPKIDSRAEDETISGPINGKDGPISRPINDANETIMR